MLKDLYTDTVSCVRLEGEVSDWFHFSCGVRQGCTVAPSLFLLPVDWVLERTSYGGFLRATLGTETFTKKCVLDSDGIESAIVYAKSKGSILFTHHADGRTLSAWACMVRKKDGSFLRTMHAVS